MTYSWTDPGSVFTSPSFGVDTAGAFSGTGNALASNPLGAGGTNMAFPVGAAIAGVGSAIGGVAGGKGAKSAADQARAAAEQQAEAVRDVNRENLFGTFGLEDVAQQQQMFFGGPRERFNAFEDQRFASAMSGSPGAQARAMKTMAQNLAARQAETEPFRRTGYSPMSRYV